MYGLRHLRSAKSSVALCLEVCEPRSFQVIILSLVLHVKFVLPRYLFSAQPTFRNFIEQLVRTVDDVIIAFSRNIPVSPRQRTEQRTFPVSPRQRTDQRTFPVSPERLRTDQRTFPVALALGVSQRASRDVKIQASIEHVISFLLVNLSSHTMRQSWAMQ